MISQSPPKGTKNVLKHITSSIFSQQRPKISRKANRESNIER